MHARIENNVVVEYPIINLRQRLPDSSLPADLSRDELLPEGFVYVHSTPAPDYSPLTHRAAAAAPAFDGEKWAQGWTLEELMADEIAEQTARAAEAVYAARRAAYQEESDPIFFQWQRGEKTQQDWLDKIAEIKLRFPDA